MAIAKRNSCIGVKDGKRCRRWKELNENGFCEKCNPAPLDESEDDRCGMCPEAGNSTGETESELELEMVQCNLCEDWFHSACIGSKDYNDFIGREEPVGTDHSKGGLAVHLWFCGVCYSEYTDLLKTLKSSFKKSVAFAPEDINHRQVNTNDVDTRDGFGGRGKKQVGRDKESSSNQNATLDRNNFVDGGNLYKPLDSVVCKYYRRGICRHGSGGKTFWNNLTCQFFHPKKCPRYTKFGRHPVKGCNNRGCKLLHPLLCHNSVMDGKCYNPNCSYQHLQGTDRVQRDWNMNASSQNYHGNSTNFFNSRNEVVSRNETFNRLQKVPVVTQNVKGQHHFTQEQDGYRNYKGSFGFNNRRLIPQDDFVYNKGDFPPNIY